MFVNNSSAQRKLTQQNWLVALILILTLAACTPKTGAPIATPEVSIPAPPQISAAPLIPPVKNDVLFAQAALKKLGYKVGQVDGLWGPRSADAIRVFEIDQNLISAGGRLSELNLSKLASLSGIERTSFSAERDAPVTQSNRKIETKFEIGAKLAQQQSQQANPPDSAPQLIIVDKSFRVLTKPNPYSSQLTTLAPGTGIYILSQREDNWYEIESINRLKGFIQDY